MSGAVDVVEIAGHRAARGSESALWLGALWNACENAWPAKGPQTRRPYREVLAELDALDSGARLAPGYIGPVAKP